jgi:hypothetical protein
MTRLMIIVMGFVVVCLTLGLAVAASRVVAPGVVGVAHPVYAFDPSDDRALAAYATDIFVGYVEKQTGSVGAPTSAPGQELPQTQFAIAVAQVVKGDAAGVVTVNQVGGLDQQTRRLMLFEGDALLRPGASELFLVVHVPERGWYQIVAGGFGHRAADDEARRAALVERFARATDPIITGEDA